MVFIRLRLMLPFLTSKGLAACFIPPFLPSPVPRAIDLDELAVAVGALLFSKARNFLSFISHTIIYQGCRQGY